MAESSQATGVEHDAAVAQTQDTRAQTTTLPQHVRFTSVEFVDRTDKHHELVHERTWMLHPAEGLALRGNLFIAEDALGGRRWIWLKEAPLPHARAVSSEVDLQIAPLPQGFAMTLQGTDGYPWHVLEYDGGELGRAEALVRLQRKHWRDLPVWFITNTWGDRNRDSRITEAFMLQELDAAARLGADLVQIDDGWQLGVTANSSQAKAAGNVGGVWEGFYAANPDFWTPHPQRFPRGLEPVLDAARERGLEVGLWFAPDSSDDFAHWQRDADTLLKLHEKYGIHCFKLDSIDVRSPAGERHIRQMIQRVNTQSQGRIVLDLDVTAGTRPGYFGMMEAATIFVENRYTDWHRYWPHATLRTLWQLARWIDARRLRMEFLNNQRNTAVYGDDPLAPAAHDPAYLFATVMFAQPLGWFEASNLPAEYFERIPDLVRIWREHRQAIFDGTIVPIGAAPEGVAWTGFVSVSSDRQRGYVLIFRQMHRQVKTVLALPEGLGAIEDVQMLYASSEAEVAGDGDGGLAVWLASPRSFVFAAVRFAEPSN